MYIACMCVDAELIGLPPHFWASSVEDGVLIVGKSDSVTNEYSMCIFTRVPLEHTHKS